MSKKKQRQGEKKNDDRGAPTQFQLKPKLAPGPRAVPLTYRLRLFLGVRFLLASMVGSLLGLPVMAVLREICEPATSLHYLPIVGGCVLGQLFSLILFRRQAWMLRHGEAVQPTVLASEDLGYNQGRTTGAAVGFFIYAGWDQVEEVSEYRATEKRLSLDLPNGRSHAFTLVTYPEPGPVYLVDPNKPKRHLTVEELIVDARPDENGQWRQPPFSLLVGVVSTINVLLAAASWVGLALLLTRA